MKHLLQFLNDEKNVRRLRFVKPEPAGVKALVRRIAMGPAPAAVPGGGQNFQT